MYPELKNNHWQPTATIATLKKRAELLAAIREFFKKRGVMEVETPLLSHATVSDPHIQSIPAFYQALGQSQTQTVYLQTSPEYAMKRLLAAGSGPIFQITKSFRQGEIGKWHNPEFTMLEWYRPGFNHQDLMNEMAAFFAEILFITTIDKISYEKIFEEFAGVNPHTASLDELIEKAAAFHTGFSKTEYHQRNFWLDFLFSHAIEPVIAKDRPLFIYDFPASQAALAKIRDEKIPVASRFEVYYKGIELANGFHELQDAAEQAKRFEKDLAYRAEHGLMSAPIDQRFLAALQHGLPDCAGVALGLDRLLMLILGCECVAETMSFDFEKA